MILSLRSLLQSLTGLLLCSLVATVPVQAETKALTAEATYIMGDGESPSFAEAMVLQKAKQTAVEQAGTYVESYTKTKNYDLTAEEIQTIAGGVLQVEVLGNTRTLVGDGLRFYIKIKATVTTDEMEELARRIKGKNVAEEYAKLQAEYARLSRELEDWKQRAAKIPQGREHEAALDHIREGEKAFAHVQQSEAEFFQRLVSGKQLVESANRDKETIDGLLKTIADSGFIVTVGEVQAVAVSGKSAHLLLTVPLMIRVSEVVHEAVSHAVSALGGTMRSDVEVSLDGGRHSFPLRFGRDTHYGTTEVSTGEVLRSGTAVTLVRLGKDLETAQYFQDEVMRLAFVVTFLNDTSELSSCRLGPQLMGGLAVGEADWFPLRRLFPVQAIHQNKTRKGRTLTRIGNGNYDLEPEMNSYSGPYSTAPHDKGYVAIVRDEAIFVAQHRLPAQSVGSLTGVRVRALSIRAKDPQYVAAPRCAIVP